MKQLVKMIKVMRIVGIFVSLGYAQFVTANASEQLHILTPLLIVFLSGLTGLESLFLAEYAAEQVGYVGNNSYQRQSGLNNLAVVITAVLVWYLNWGILAEASLMTVTLIFYAMSGINHAYSAIRYNNRTLKNAFRPILSFILIVAVLPILLAALRL